MTFLYFYVSTNTCKYHFLLYRKMNFFFKPKPFLTLKLKVRKIVICKYFWKRIIFLIVKVFCRFKSICTVNSITKCTVGIEGFWMLKKRTFSKSLLVKDYLFSRSHAHVFVVACETNRFKRLNKESLLAARN